MPKKEVDRLLAITEAMFAERDAFLQQLLQDGKRGEELEKDLAEYDRQKDREREQNRSKGHGGRKPLPENKRRNHRFQVNLNDEEFELLTRLGSEKDLSVLARELLLEAAVQRWNKKEG